MTKFLHLWLVLSSLSVGIIAGLSVILTTPFEYEIAAPADAVLCPGEWLEFETTVITYHATVTEVVREWEGTNYAARGGSFLAVVESDRHAWQFWITPDRSTFTTRVQVPEDVSLGYVEFQQGAHSGIALDEVFVVPITVVECGG